MTRGESHKAPTQTTPGRVLWGKAMEAVQQGLRVRFSDVTSACLGRELPVRASVPHHPEVTTQELLGSWEDYTARPKQSSHLTGSMSVTTGLLGNSVHLVDKNQLTMDYRTPIKGRDCPPAPWLFTHTL